jgi:hypothetical protein
MRLPGTINVPNKTKKRNGRVPVLACLIEELCNWDREYGVGDFSHICGPASTPVTPNGLRIASVRLENLPASLPPLTRRLIEFGDDPERPIGSANARYPSRSEPAYRVVIDLLKAGCEPDFVASVLLCADLGISASIREKRDPKSYAARQIRSAAAALADGWPDPDRSGRPRPTFRNAMVALQRLGLSFEYDEFHRRKTIGGKPIQEFAGEITDDTCAVARRIVLETFGFDAGREHIREAVNTLCLDNIYHPLREYLQRLRLARNLPRR